MKIIPLENRFYNEAGSIRISASPNNIVSTPPHIQPPDGSEENGKNTDSY